MKINNKITAVIMAGGKGTRLRPYTISLPKPLVPVGNQPIIDIIIKQLAKCGFYKISIAVNHMADIIIAYIGDGKKYDVSIEYSIENIPLGTIGPLKCIENLDDNFIVMNGDVLTDINYRKMLKQHINSKADLTIAAVERISVIDFGVLKTDSNRLVEYLEKPQYTNLVSTGIYILNKSLINLIPAETNFGINNLVEILLQHKDRYNICLFKHTGYWLDIGRPDDYQKACDDVESLNN